MAVPIPPITPEHWARFEANLRRALPAAAQVALDLAAERGHALEIRGYYASPAVPCRVFAQLRAEEFEPRVAAALWQAGFELLRHHTGTPGGVSARAHFDGLPVAPLDDAALGFAGREQLELLLVAHPAAPRLADAQVEALRRAAGPARDGWLDAAQVAIRAPRGRAQLQELADAGFALTEKAARPGRWHVAPLRGKAAGG